MTLSMKILSSLALIGLLAILGGVGAATFFFGGFFNVAANHPDPNIVSWALVQVRKASITRRATDRSPWSLVDPDMIQAGSVAYTKNGCINCHGEPGVQSAKFSEGLNPPPDLRKVVTDRRPEELFWVIKNGIKMSAMPSFDAGDPPLRDKQIWAIVAFLKMLSSVSGNNFKAWNETPLGGYWESGCELGRTSGCEHPTEPIKALGEPR